MDQAGMKRRAGRLLFAVLAFVLLATIAPAPPRKPLPGPGESLLFAVPVPLDASDSQRRHVGAFRFRRGWQLTSPDRRLGGISAIHVDRGQVMAISDSGVLIEFPLPLGGGAGRVRFTPLQGPGSATDRRNRDTESLALSVDHAWVGFERHHMIWRYRRGKWNAEASAGPEAMRGWNVNSGAETLVRLGDERFLAIAEGPDGAEFSEALLFGGDPAEAGTGVTRLLYRRLEGFRPTDAALLPDGRLLVLNRSIGLLGGMKAKLALVSLEGSRPGRILEGREIATIASPLTVDNMEAISISREAGRIIVRIASDDNFFPLQRTLLLEFELDERALEAPPTDETP
jgi:hypothetical protein